MHRQKGAPDRHLLPRPRHRHMHRRPVFAASGGSNRATGQPPSYFRWLQHVQRSSGGPGGLRPSRASMHVKSKLPG